MTDNEVMFWQNVKLELTKQNMQLKELCLITGLNSGTVYNQSCKNICPDLTSAFKIAQALNLPLEYLVTGAMPKDTVTLSTNAKKLLNDYSRLTPLEQKAVSQIIECLLMHKF